MALHPNALPAGYVWVKSANGEYYIKALLQVNPSQYSMAEAGLRATGGKVGTKAGNVWTATIPADKVSDVAKIAGIKYLQLDEPLYPAMDSARKTTRIDSVHGGFGLPMAYTGKDVVVGIIDAGFDYGHPSLFDTTGVGYKVRRVWEQKNNSGTPPNGYSYGYELTDSSAMWTKGYDASTLSHGAHVAGIAAGSGYGGDSTNRRVRGMAYGSDLVFVGITPEPDQWLSTGMTDIIDGMNYVYNYAASVGKPAIANLSWGCSMGPHDGSSLFSQACDALTGTGKLFALSAGNNGDEDIHLKKQFSVTDTVLNSFMNFSTYLPEKRTWIDIWGDTAKTFCAALTLYSGGDVATTGFICLDDSLHENYLIGTDNDTLFATIVTESSSFNGKPHIQMQLYSKTGNSVYISVKATDGVVNAWNGFVLNTTGYYGAFTDGGKSWAQNGDKNSTIGDMASTRSAITVGAYASKTTFKALNGTITNYTSYTQRGQRARFSSRGPVVNGAYMKPDITGPGLTLASAVSSYDASMQPGGSSEDALVAHYLNTVDNRDYYYAQLMGTSMSSPAVSGIIALMLQADPSLTPNGVRSLLRETAIKDNFTSQTPDSNLWGAGKVNAYGAVMRSAGVSSVAALSTKSSLPFKLYPNPAKQDFKISYSASMGERVQLTIVNTAGIPVWADTWKSTGTNNIKDITARLIPGNYFIKLNIENREGAQKLTIY